MLGQEWATEISADTELWPTFSIFLSFSAREFLFLKLWNKNKIQVQIWINIKILTPYFEEKIEFTEKNEINVFFAFINH